MTRIKLSENGNTPFEKVIGHNMEILKKWKELDEIFWRNSSLDKNLLEQIRRTTAFENGCEYCMVKGGKPDFNKNEAKISFVTAFAGLFCNDHHSISGTHFEVLREYFPDEEISELLVFITFINASQKLGKVFNLTEDLQKQAVIKLEN